VNRNLAKRKIPKVFLSYSQTSTDHMIWVKNLVKNLQAEGIIVIYDQYDLLPGQNKHFFMQRIITDQSISKVLIICTADYKYKADNFYKGVGDETKIIQQEIENDNGNQNKFIPILTEDKDLCLPNYLKDSEGKNTNLISIKLLANTLKYDDEYEYHMNYTKLVSAIINKDLNTFYSDKIEIIELKFFAGDKQNCPGINQRQYRNSFKSSKLKYIYFELRFKHRIKSKSYNAVINYQIRDNNGNIICINEQKTELICGCNRLWIWYGYDIAGQWPLGKYSVIIGLQNSNKIERYFNINP
jgi:hypothetical protein